MSTSKEKERLQKEAENARINFCANVTHQLKTPLHSILGYSELIANGMAAGEDARKFGFRIHMEAQKTLNMVNEILALSRLDDPGEIFEKRDVDICAVVSDVVTSFKNMAEMKGVSLELETPGVCDKNTILNASSKLLVGITENLIDNALCFTESGGSINVYVSVNSDSRPVLTVKDTGIGIPYEEQDKVFQRFYRVDKSASSETGGTGLGLTIVKQSAWRLGADIELESVPGKGTEIRVIF